MPTRLSGLCALSPSTQWCIALPVHWARGYSCWDIHGAECCRRARLPHSLPGFAGRYWPVRRPKYYRAQRRQCPTDDIKNVIMPAVLSKPTGTAGRLLCRARLYPRGRSRSCSSRSSAVRRRPTVITFYGEPMNWRQMANDWDITPHLCQIRCPVLRRAAKTSGNRAR